MIYFTIYHAGRKIGGEFGEDAQHALDRYAEGSIFPRAELTAVRGPRASLCGHRRDRAAGQPETLGPTGEKSCLRDNFFA